MSLAVALVLLAQASGVPVTGAPGGSAAGPVATTATASARILRPAIITFVGEFAAEADHGDSPAIAPTRRRDERGTQWIEFS